MAHGPSLQLNISLRFLMRRCNGFYFFLTLSSLLFTVHTELNVSCTLIVQLVHIFQSESDNQTWQIYI